MNFYLKVGDTSPPLRVTVKDETGAVIDLTGCTVTFSMRLKSTGVVKVDAAAAVVQSGTGGILRYDWLVANTDTAGLYEGEFDVTFPSGAKETAPNNYYIAIDIKESAN